MQIIDGQRFPTVTETGIYGFFGEYRFLSNFEPCLIVLEGIAYPSTEHAYVAGKSDDRAWKDKVAALLEPKAAKKLGRQVKLREDWEHYRLAVMTLCVRQKFQDPILRDKLLKTGEKYLEETNNWKDHFWGVCEGKGANMLGKILMLVRADLRAELAKMDGLGAVAGGDPELL